MKKSPILFTAIMIIGLLLFSSTLLFASSHSNVEEEKEHIKENTHHIIHQTEKKDVDHHSSVDSSVDHKEAKAHNHETDHEEEAHKHKTEAQTDHEEAEAHNHETEAQTKNEHHEVKSSHQTEDHLSVHKNNGHAQSEDHIKKEKQESHNKPSHNKSVGTHDYAKSADSNFSYIDMVLICISIVFVGFILVLLSKEK